MDAEVGQGTRKRMKYLTCDKPMAHQGEFLNLICIESGCPERGLICSICKAEAHDKHRVIPLRMFLEEVLKCHRSAETAGIADVLHRLDDNKNSVLLSLQSTVQALASAVRRSEQDVLSYYSAVRKDVLSRIQTNQELSDIVAKLLQCDFESDKQAKEEVARIVQNLRVDTSKPHSTQPASESASTLTRCWSSRGGSTVPSRATWPSWASTSATTWLSPSRSSAPPPKSRPTCFRGSTKPARSRCRPAASRPRRYKPTHQG